MMEKLVERFGKERIVLTAWIAAIWVAFGAEAPWILAEPFLSLRWLRVAALYGAGIVALVFLARRAWLPRADNPLLFLALFAIAGLVSSAFASLAPEIALPWGLAYLATALAMLAATAPGKAKDDRRARNAFDAVLLLAALTGVLLLFFALTKYDMLDMIAEGRVARIYGQHVDTAAGLHIIANGVGRFAAILVIVGLSRSIHSHGGARLAAVQLTVAMAALLVYSMSRTALAAFIPALAVYLWMSGRASRRLGFAFGGLAVAALAIGAPFLGTYLRRGESFEMILSLTGRTPVWADAWALTWESDILGWGFMADRLMLSDLVHNGPLLALLTAGVVGFAFYALAWGLTWRNLARVARHRRELPPDTRKHAAEAAAIIVFLSIRMITEPTAAFFGVDLLLFAVAAGVVTSIHYSLPRGVARARREHAPAARQRVPTDALPEDR